MTTEARTQNLPKPPEYALFYMAFDNEWYKSNDFHSRSDGKVAEHVEDLRKQGFRVCLLRADWRILAIDQPLPDAVPDMAKRLAGMLAEAEDRASREGNSACEISLEMVELAQAIEAALEIRTEAGS